MNTSEIVISARQHITAGQNDTALELLSDPSIDSYFEGLVFRGLLYLASLQIQHALDDLSAALAIQQDDPTVAGHQVLTALHHGRGECLMRQQSFEAAIVEFQTAMAHSVSPLTTMLRLGDCYNQLNMSAKAISEYSKVIRRDKNEVSAYIGRADVFSRDPSKLHMALKDYSTAISMLSSGHLLANIHFRRGNVHREREEFGPALDEYNRCLEMHPNFSPAMEAKGAIFLIRDEAKLALEQFDAVLAASATLEARFGRGLACLQLKHFDESIADFSLLTVTNSYLSTDAFGSRARHMLN